MKVERKVQAAQVFVQHPAVKLGENQ